MPQTKQPQTQTSSDLSGPFSTARPVTIGVIKIVMAAGQWTRHAAWQAVVRSWVADVRKNANPPHPSSASQPTPPPFAASTPKDTCKYILLSHYMAEFFPVMCYPVIHVLYVVIGFVRVTWDVSIPWDFYEKCDKHYFSCWCVSDTPSNSKCCCVSSTHRCCRGKLVTQCCCCVSTTKCCCVFTTQCGCSWWSTSSCGRPVKQSWHITDGQCYVLTITTFTLLGHSTIPLRFAAVLCFLLLFVVFASKNVPNSSRIGTFRKYRM